MASTPLPLAHTQLWLCPHSPSAPEGLGDGGDSDREGDMASSTPGTRQQRAARCCVARWRRRLRNGRQGMEGPVLGNLGHHGATEGSRSHRATRGAQHSPLVSPGCPMSPQAPVQGHHRARAARPPWEKQPVVKRTPLGLGRAPCGAFWRGMRTCGAIPSHDSLVSLVTLKGFMPGHGGRHSPQHRGGSSSMEGSSCPLLPYRGHSSSERFRGSPAPLIHPWDPTRPGIHPGTGCHRHHPGQQMVHRDGQGEPVLQSPVSK